MVSEHYDIIIIGSGPGGATMAWRLAKTGKRILLIERGDYLPRERENWDSRAVFVEARYQATETWYDSTATASIRACITSSAATARSTARRCSGCASADFGEVLHADGISPAWPVDMTSSSRTTGRPRSCSRCTARAARIRPSRRPAKPYAASADHATSRASRHCATDSRGKGTQPFHLPVGACWTRRTARRCRHSPASAATRSTAIPCLVNGKADAQVICVDPGAAAHPNLTLLTNAYVERLETDPRGPQRHRRRGDPRTASG